MKAPKQKQLDPVPAGNHVARLYSILHIGTINNPYKGQDRQVNTVRLTFELCNERKEFKEGEDEKPYSISQEYTFSMNKKSHLEHLVEGLLGKSLTDAEAANIEIEEMLGKACLLNVIHREAKASGNLYANIAGASPLPKGIEVPVMFNPAKWMSVLDASQEELDKLPDFLVKKVQSSEEYQQRFYGVEPKETYSQDDGEVDYSNDIPFD